MVAASYTELEQLRELFPHPPQALGSYQSVSRDGQQVYVSGFGPFQNGRPITGIVGGDMSVVEARESAKLSMLMILSCLDDAFGLENVNRCLRLTVYIRADASFVDHAAVSNGASDLLKDLFGPENVPVRTSLGVHTLPLGFPLEIDSIFQLKDGISGQ
jgi:enamine deaminase RidA (YjgF/YER057c/UK114 family)